MSLRGHFLKILLISVLCLFVILSLFTNIITANAKKSEATIEFTSGSSDSTPLNPNDMNRNLVPRSSLETSQEYSKEASGLSFDYIHTPGINFAKQSADIPKSHHIQISDVRGNDAGWIITAELGQMMDVKTGKKLRNIQLDFSDIEMITNGVGAAPISNNTMTIYAGDDSKIMAEANFRTGQGVWIQRWNTSLKSRNTTNSHNEAGQSLFKKDKLKESYASELTWTLITAPMN